MGQETMTPSAAPSSSSKKKRKAKEVEAGKEEEKAPVRRRGRSVAVPATPSAAAASSKGKDKAKVGGATGSSKAVGGSGGAQSAAAWKVAVTCVEADAETKRQIKSLGLSLVDDLREADIVIAGDRAAGVAARRTAKVMGAVCSGLPLVDISWLHASIKKGQAVDTRAREFIPDYLPPQHKNAVKLPAATVAALGTAGAALFLEDWAVLAAFKSFGSGGIPPKADLRLVVECAGGAFYDKPSELEAGQRKKRGRKGNILILSNEANLGLKTWGMEVREFASKHKAVVGGGEGGIHGLEVLLAGAMQQKLGLGSHVLWEAGEREDEKEEAEEEEVSQKEGRKRGAAAPALAAKGKGKSKVAAAPTPAAKKSKGKVQAVVVAADKKREVEGEEEEEEEEVEEKKAKATPAAKSGRATASAAAVEKKGGTPAVAPAVRATRAKAADMSAVPAAATSKPKPTAASSTSKGKEASPIPFKKPQTTTPAIGKKRGAATAPAFAPAVKRSTRAQSAK